MGFNQVKTWGLTKKLCPKNTLDPPSAKKNKDGNLVSDKDALEKLYIEIKKINLNLWNIEDKIRIYEKRKDFTQKFIDLARSVYFNNDERSRIKAEINKLLGSNIKEVKQYTDY